MKAFFRTLLYGPPNKGLTEEEARELIIMAKEAQKGLDEGGRVPFSSLKSVPWARSKNDALVVNEGIDCYHLELHDDNLSIWDTHMKPNSQFGIHDHDVAEQIWVLDGQCIVDGELVSQFGTRMFGKEHEHNVSSKDGCHLIVLFRNV